MATEFQRSKLRIRRSLAGGWVALPVGWGTTAASGSTDNLLAASARGDVGAVRAQLAKGGDVNFREEVGRTPLMLAARDGLESEVVRRDVVAALLAAGPKPTPERRVTSPRR